VLLLANHSGDPEVLAAAMAAAREAPAAPSPASDRRTA
jgi:hypothetical protein